MAIYLRYHTPTGYPPSFPDVAGAATIPPLPPSSSEPSLGKYAAGWERGLGTFSDETIKTVSASVDGVIDINQRCQDAIIGPEWGWIYETGVLLCTGGGLLEGFIDNVVTIVPRAFEAGRLSAGSDRDQGVAASQVLFISLDLAALSEFVGGKSTKTTLPEIPPHLEPAFVNINFVTVAEGIEPRAAFLPPFTPLETALPSVMCSIPLRRKGGRNIRNSRIIRHAAAKLLREARQRAKITQKSLAEQVGLSSKSLHQIEIGLHTPGLQKLAILLNKLGLSVEDFRALIQERVFEKLPNQTTPQECALPKEIELAAALQDEIDYYCPSDLTRIVNESLQ